MRDASRPRPTTSAVGRELVDNSVRRLREGVGDDLVEGVHFITPASCTSSAPARSR